MLALLRARKGPLLQLLRAPRLVRACSCLASLVFAGLIAWALIHPEDTLPRNRVRAGQAVTPTKSDPAQLLNRMRSRALFEPAVPLPTRRIAQQSVDRVLQLLALRGVLEIQGVPTAYIEIKGEGMKGFRVGDGVEDLFTVTRIEGRNVEVRIAGEIALLRI
jgi:hypothetical protein